MSGKLYLCATPIGNLGDITYRCVEVLKSVDMIAAEDTRRTLGLLNHLGIEKPMTSYFEHNRREKGEYLISLMKEGKNIALVSDAGTPAISDPGEDLVALCAENDVCVVPVPGAVAGINALIASGLPTGRFTFEGFLTVNKRGRCEMLKSLENEERTMIFYEAPHKLRTTLKDMYAAFGERRICLCREITKIHEEFFRTTLSEAIAHYEENPPRGEFVLVIEGKSRRVIEDEQKSEWENITVREHVDMYIKKGMDEKEAIKAAAKDRSVPKRDIYNEYKR
ncbi:MAG: 16S rRNA (cytidine(1402)-2'-O)-methyltransferase [Clostridia bacterium]|nr:16S rRNA (cytidine(1402)-2'-O)-methyltransferase [Clostridia bacterium]MBR2883515.1 16S rRNA (cytidine(1402)-2'-O)-methyltransferase [Clostridia bacterium]